MSLSVFKSFLIPKQSFQKISLFSGYSEIIHLWILIIYIAQFFWSRKSIEGKTRTVDTKKKVLGLKKKEFKVHYKEKWRTAA